MATIISKTDYAENTRRKVLRAEDFDISAFTIADNVTWVAVAPDVAHIRHACLLQFQGDGTQIMEVNVTESSVGAMWFNSSQAISELTGLFANYSGVIYVKLKDAGTAVTGVFWEGK
jgi:hypothetical protein